MSFTFGGAATDDITYGVGPTMGATGRAGLVCGWWRPTTLTATRGLWSAGNTFGAEIDSATDELRLRTDNTTDGQWTTGGVDLVVDEWRFLAFLSTTTNTGPAAAWRVWAGDVNTPPAEVTVTNAVSPSGNFTGNANFYIGNKGTGSLAFQGDVSDVTTISCSVAAGASTHPFALNAHGAITDAEALFVYERFVAPIWQGNLFPPASFTTGALLSSAYTVRHVSLSGAQIPRALTWTLGTEEPGGQVTLAGATASAMRGPRSSMGQLLPNHQPLMCMRR